MQELSPRQKVAFLTQYEAIPREPIKQYIPKRPGTTPLGTFKMLMAIIAKPCVPLSNLRIFFNTGNESLNNSVKYLIELGFITIVKRSRWISQINAWIVDDTYKPTKKGEDFVFKIVDLVQTGSDPTEINAP